MRYVDVRGTRATMRFALIDHIVAALSSCAQRSFQGARRSHFRAVDGTPISLASRVARARTELDKRFITTKTRPGRVRSRCWEAERVNDDRMIEFASHLSPGLCRGAPDRIRTVVSGSPCAFPCCLENRAGHSRPEEDYGVIDYEVRHVAARRSIFSSRLDLEDVPCASERIGRDDEVLGAPHPDRPGRLHSVDCLGAGLRRNRPVGHPPRYRLD